MTPAASGRTAPGASRLRALLALPLLVATSSQAQDAPLSFRAGAFSALIVRGLLLSDTGSPVVLASADAYSSAGWSAGMSVMSLRAMTGAQAGGWTIRAARDWSLSEAWTLSVAARHDAYFGDAYLRGWCYDQADVTATYGDIWNATASWRPNGGIGCPEPTVKKPDFAVDFTAQWPIAAGFGADAGVGRLFDGGWTSYDYGQWGLFANASSLSLHLGRTWTHGVSPDAYGPLAKPRWVASAVWRF